MLWLKHKKRNIINKFEIASGFARKNDFFLDSSLAIIKLILGFILFFAFLTNVSFAAYEVEIGLPGMATKSFSDPGQYVKYLFIFGLSLAAFLAVGAITFGGVKYMLAGASIGSVQQAKDLIIGALTGIVLLLVSYLLLATIDPTLTNLSPSLTPVGNLAAPVAPVTPVTP